MSIEYSDFIDPSDVSVAKFWMLYREVVLPAYVSKVQHDETKKAFYAGFAECFKIMSDYAASLTQEQACLLFTKINDECLDWIDNQIKKDRENGFRKS